MITKTAIGIGFVVLLAGAAKAECDHNGVTYSVGATICAAGGWLQECTPAGYWKAIGMCRAPDQLSEPADSDSERNPVARMADERLVVN